MIHSVFCRNEYRGFLARRTTPLFRAGRRDGLLDAKIPGSLPAFHAMLCVQHTRITDYERGYLNGYGLSGAYVEDMSFLPPYPASMVRDPRDLGLPVDTTRSRG